MTVLGFDTALPTTSACVVREDGEVFATPAPEPSALLGSPTHSRELLPELDALIRRSGTAWSDVESIVVGAGPGTFTGLRIGVATARALAQALGVGVRPVSSLEALALAAERVATAVDRPLLSVIDARRGQVFAAVYLTAERVESLSTLRAPAVMDPDDVFALAASLDSTPLAVGDWAVRSAEGLEEAGAEIPPLDSGLHAVDAVYVCKLGMTVQPVAPEQVKPIYLRLPDVDLKKASR